MGNKGEIIIYENPEHGLEIQVRLENDTLWLSQRLMAELFEKDSDTIGLHIKNIFAESELDELSTTEKISVVQIEGKRRVSRQVKYYNLDVIISVGYRVNSKRGTQFRIWATQRLKDYLVRGFALNEKRLLQFTQNLQELEQTIAVIHQGGDAQALQLTDAKGLLDIIAHYTRSFILLNRFDSNELRPEPVNEHITYEIQYNEAIKAIHELKNQLMAKKKQRLCSETPKTTVFKAYLVTLYKLSEANTCTAVSKNRQLTYYT